MSIIVDGKKIKSFIFSGGECHVDVSSIIIVEVCKVVALLNDSNDIMFLLLTIDAIRRCNSSVAICLTIPYFPYARQDRVCNFGESLSVKVMTDLINSLKCERVTILDPHSDVTPALIDNCRVIPMSVLVNNNLLCKIKYGNLSIVSPDMGSEKKVSDIAKYIYEDESSSKLIKAYKERDVTNGNIIGTSFVGDVKGKNLIILDDICDGGRTFIELAKLLKEKGACNIYLYVTHGIFSKGIGELLNYINIIYCYHIVGSYVECQNDRLIILGEDYEY